MKEMKKLVLICLVAMMAIMQSCKDECKDVNCQNGGSCIEGTCECLEGFSGTNCETRGIDAFIGAWTGNNVCPDEDPLLINVDIAEIEGSDTMVTVAIDGEDPFTATLIDGTLVIPEETVEFFGIVVTTSGEAEVNSDDQLILDITTVVEGVPIVCTFTGIQ